MNQTPIVKSLHWPDEQACQSFAQQLSHKPELASAVRDAEPNFALELLTPDDAVQRAMARGEPGRPVVLADTVGFIRELPHELVAAFRSTLTEAREATLLAEVTARFRAALLPFRFTTVLLNSSRTSRAAVRFGITRPADEKVDYEEPSSSSRESTEFDELTAGFGVRPVKNVRRVSILHRHRRPSETVS